MGGTGFGRKWSRKDWSVDQRPDGSTFVKVYEHSKTPQQKEASLLFFFPPGAKRVAPARPSPWLLCLPESARE